LCCVFEGFLKIFLILNYSYRCIPLLTGLDTGLVLARNDSSSAWTSIIVTGGLALINDNKITILVNEAELGSDVNIQEAEDGYLASKIALESNLDVTRNFELTSQFKKARARFQYTQLSKNIS
jgi:F-type H+-transporting ATPase subunit epsilon